MVQVYELNGKLSVFACLKRALGFRLSSLSAPCAPLRVNNTGALHTAAALFASSLLGIPGIFSSPKCLKDSCILEVLLLLLSSSSHRIRE